MPGAGPSGIIAAKTLLHDHPHGAFKVTVFEQSDRIGGLWPLFTTDDGMVNPDMCTNLSRHTVSFSDMAWSESSPTFPKAWQAGQYLKSYISKYAGLDIQTSSKVLKAWRSLDTTSGAKRWKIEVEKRASSPRNQSSTVELNTMSEDTLASGHAGNRSENELSKPSIETHYCDYLIVASGFFGKPKLPSASSSSGTFLAPIQHSTQFRNIETLLQGNKAGTPSQGSKVLVVGGSMSGAEVAASIAMQLSSHVYSPKTSQTKDAAKYTVFHVIKRPFWVMPCFLPVNPLLETDPNLPKVCGDLKPISVREPNSSIYDMYETFVPPKQASAAFDHLFAYNC
jgi:cation diffusion facilitator CzcD-associated flavoprotein CzcO